MFLSLSLLLVSVGDSLTVSDICQYWSETAVPEAKCQFTQVVTRWDDLQLSPSVADVFAKAPAIDVDKPVRNEFAGFLHRNVGVGMKARYEGHDLNIIDGVATSITDATISNANPADRLLVEGMRAVRIVNGERGLISKLSNTSVFLYWLDPMESKLGKYMRKLGDLSIARAPSQEHGEIGTVSVAGDHGKIDLVLSKKFDWRIVELSRFNPDGARVKTLSVKYGRSESGQIEMHGWKSLAFFSGVDHPWRSESSTVTSIAFECTRENIELEIPRNSVVDDSINGVRAIVKKDGEIRQVHHGELQAAESFTQLYQTEAGDLLPSHRLSFFGIFLVAAIVLIGMGVLGVTFVSRK